MALVISISKIWDDLQVDAESINDDNSMAASRIELNLHLPATHRLIR